MQVVLNETVKNLGFKGQVVSVKAGYFRNFLFPNGLADAATKARLKVAELRKDKIVMEKEQVMANAAEVIEKLKGLSVIIKEKVSDKGTLYGSVTEAEVAAAVKAATKVELDASSLKMDHFKELGEYEVLVRIAEGSETTIKVVVEEA